MNGETRATAEASDWEVVWTNVSLPTIPQPVNWNGGLRHAVRGGFSTIKGALDRLHRQC
jgi:hypothetical protein